MTAHKPHKDKTLAQQAAIAQKPSKKPVTLVEEPEAFRPTHQRIAALQDKIHTLITENVIQQQEIMRQADKIKRLERSLRRQ